MLTRWDPFRDMVSMRRAMDRLIENSLGEDGEWAQQSNWTLPLDVSENEDAYLIKASVPGINPEDIDITFSSGTLTIKGEVKEDREVEREQYRLRERRFGSFQRTIQLPGGVKQDQIDASYENGVLRLQVPKADEVKPKRIPIRAHEGQKVIESSFNNGQ